MSAILDVVNAQLVQAVGRAGPTQDLLAAHLRNETGASQGATVTDMWVTWLTSRGATGSAFPDMMDSYLRGEGLSGALPDMLMTAWEQGLFTAPAVPPGVFYSDVHQFDVFEERDWCVVAPVEHPVVVPTDCDCIVVAISTYHWEATVEIEAQGVITQVPLVSLAQSANDRAGHYVLAGPPTGAAIVRVVWPNSPNAAGCLTVSYMRGVSQTSPIANSIQYGLRSTVPIDELFTYPGESLGCFHMMAVMEYYDSSFSAYPAIGDIEFKGESGTTVGYACGNRNSYYRFYQASGDNYTIQFVQPVPTNVRAISSILLRPEVTPVSAILKEDGGAILTEAGATLIQE